MFQLRCSKIMKLRNLMIAVSIVAFTGSGIGAGPAPAAAGDGKDRPQPEMAEFAYALGPISPEAVEQIEAFEAEFQKEFPGATWILPFCYGKVKVPALMAEFGRRAKLAWIPPSYAMAWSQEIPLLATEMASGGFSFELKDGSREYRSITRVSVDSPDAVLKFGREETFDHPGEGPETTLTELFLIANPYPDRPPAPVAVSDAISSAVFCTQTGADDVSDNLDPSYVEAAWVKPRGVLGKEDCGAFLFSRHDGSDVVMRRCLPR